MAFKKLFLTGLSIMVLSFSFAQEEDIFGISRKAKNPKSESSIGNVYRNVLEQFALEISTGGGYQEFRTSFFSENPDLYPLFQYQNFDEPLDISEENPLQMKGGDWVFPVLNAGVRINLFNLFTIGGGYGIESGNISPMRGGNFEFPFEGASYQASKFYGTLGIVLWDANRRAKYLQWRYRRYASANLYMQSELRQRVRQIYPWRLVLEAEYGNLSIKKFVDPTLTQNGNYTPRLAVADPYFGLGLRLERDFSEYTKLFLKGGVDLRSFTYSSSDFSEFQELDQRLYAMQIGLAIRIPGTKRCKIQGCGVVMKHMHNGIEYRGSSIFKLQDRKIGQWY
ncbi:hypothetical protein E4S40_04220 [Algoriphagus kandeliae]|uniref:DUF4421 domain-containing protein n=1 Tax=Algoriphagus kandeliae TaxID=2562278 RepID=A0A4Y9QZ70_9BACT|nr:hypothetical protein [Algoriphagus kandeliae]TFV97854.1 hypothetical protein E4S40_04220 [Algoriphagus kandeliae]